MIINGLLVNYGILGVLPLAFEVSGGGCINARPYSCRKSAVFPLVHAPILQKVNGIAKVTPAGAAGGAL